MAQNKESTFYIFKIAILLSLVCAALVSFGSVLLKPIQDENAAKEKKKNILIAAGIYEDGGDIDTLFKANIQPKVIELASGQKTDEVDVAVFDSIKAAKDPQLGKSVEDDTAKIGFISKYETIYELKNKNDVVEKIVLPIRGYGLWGTMYGFLAVDNKGETIQGITFYDQKETPGLGGEIQNPSWQAKWVGKKPYKSGSYEPVISMPKTLSNNEDVAIHQVDALAGATLTTRGVENTVNFWLGKQGYAPYIQSLNQ